MKKILLFLSLFLSANIYAQSNIDFRTELDNIKNELKLLKMEIQSVVTQNNYLKKALDLNSPILEITNNNVNYQIINISKNINEKSVSIILLINTNENDLKYNLLDFSLIDLNGNSYKFDFSKSSDTFPKLTKQVPVKFIATFLGIPSDLKILKLFKFSTKINPESGSVNTIKSVQMFKDLIIN